MKKRIQRWFRNWLLIDLVGIIIGVGLIIFYILKSSIISNNNVLDIWSNLATEIVGVWLSVRIIDKVLESRNKKNHSRLNLLKNLHHFYQVSLNFIKWHDPKKTDLEELIKEQKFFLDRWDKRKKRLYLSEIEKLKQLEELKTTILQVITDLISFKDQELDKKYENKKKELKIELVEYDRVLDELREDIWEESHPDEI